MNIALSDSSDAINKP